MPGDRAAGGAGRGQDRAGAGPLLEVEFGRWSLYLLRHVVHEHAAAGMPAGRVQDLVLAVHELASNAVRHGAGTGRARLWRRDGALCCQVEDAGQAPRDGRAADGAGAAGWPCEPGHGLWVVRLLSDEMSVTCGPDGTRATVVFALR